MRVCLLHLSRGILDWELYQGIIRLLLQHYWVLIGYDWGATGVLLGYYWAVTEVSLSAQLFKRRLYMYTVELCYMGP